TRANPPRRYFVRPIGATNKLTVERADGRKYVLFTRNAFVDTRREYDKRRALVLRLLEDAVQEQRTQFLAACMRDADSEDVRCARNAERAIRSAEEARVHYRPPATFASVVSEYEHKYDIDVADFPVRDLFHFGH